MKFFAMFKKNRSGGITYKESPVIGWLKVLSILIILVFVFIVANPAVSYAKDRPGPIKLAKVECIEGGSAAVCGNGVVEEDEACDCNDVKGKTCTDLGYPMGGVLACKDDCTYDTTGCISCGNGIKDPGEECDKWDFGDVTCESLGGFPDRSPDCTKDCKIDLCSCGEPDIGYDQECVGGASCGFLLTKESCLQYQEEGCSWIIPEDEGDMAPVCFGILDCPDLNEVPKYHDPESYCESYDYCGYRPRICGCWGPEVSCGFVQQLDYDNSGERCSTMLSCAELNVYWNGNYCWMGIALMDMGTPEVPETYMVIVYDSGGIMIRKLLKELPLKQCNF